MSTETEKIIENQIAIINLIASLSKQILGKKVQVTIWDKEGNYTNTIPNIANITWLGN